MIPTPAMVQTFKRAWKTADTLGLEGQRTKIALQAALENIYPTFPTMFHAVNGRPRWGGGAVMLFSKAGEGKTTELARAAVATKHPLILLNSPAANFREHFTAVPLDELPAGARLFGGVKVLHDVHEALDSGPGDEHEYIFVDTADMVATPLYAFQSLDAFAQERGITIFTTGKLSRDHVAGDPLPVAGVDAAEVRVHGFPCIIGGRV